MDINKIQINGVTYNIQDTTYESKQAASGGTDLSLVTTGEKYIWNQDTKYGDVVYDTTNQSDNILTSGALQLDGNKPIQTIAIDGNVTSVSFASGKLPPIGHSCHVIFTASTEKTIALAHVTTGSVRYICPEGTTPEEISIPAGGYAEIDFLRTPDTTESDNTVSWIYVRGI